ncbi:MAG: hypothetical protein GY772_21075 [bacterium]|nr:hypothetical protein [bacterium]
MQPPVTLWTWEPGNLAGAKRMVATCGSWRCEGCRRRRASIDYARIVEALEPHDPKDVIFAVLTLDRNGRYSGKEWSDPEAAYRELSRMTRNWMSRLNYWLAKNKMETVGSRWVATVEAHRRGWPHLNVVMVAPQLAQRLGELRDERAQAGLSGREQTLVEGDLQEMVTGTGWGVQSTMEQARSKEALAGYVIKVAGEADKSYGALAGEVSKMTQVPENAPKGMRRLRSGKGFLPPRRVSGRTGVCLEREDTGGVKIAGRKSERPDDKTARAKWDRRQREVHIVMKAESKMTPAHIQDPTGKNPGKVDDMRAAKVGNWDEWREAVALSPHKMEITPDGEVIRMLIVGGLRDG